MGWVAMKLPCVILALRLGKLYKTASSRSRKALKLGMSILRWSILPFVTRSHKSSLVA
jgi:hypothetical protein